MAVTPQQVYQDLLNAGASTTEAGGILANAINESNINPEAVGDQGTSFGFVQEHGNYSYLVTGNAANDINSQIALLRSQGAISAASGTSISQAAGNFAANFEKCVGCQPGGAQYNSRVANAAKVQGWISGGNWPQTATDTSAGFTIPNPLNLLPGNIGQQITSGIADSFFGYILKALGLPSLKDSLERFALMVLGFVLVLVGLYLLTGGTSKGQPIQITTTSTPEETTTTRRVNAPGVKHTSTTVKGAESTTKKASKGIASEAIEAAAVA